MAERSVSTRSGGGLKFKMEGFEEITKELQRLSGTMAGRVIRRGLNSSAQVIRDGARKILRSRNYERRTWMSPLVVNQRNPDKHSVRVHITYRKDQYWLIFLELGTEEHDMAIKGRSRVLGYKADSGEWITFGRSGRTKGISPRPWLRPAYDENKVKAIDSFAANLRMALDKELARQAKRRRR